MFRRRLLVVIGLAITGSCFSQDLCSLPEQARGFAPPHNEDAYSVLDAIGKVGPFQTRTIRLFPSSSDLVRQRGGAAAELCGVGGTERWIFYDPAYINGIKPIGGDSDLPRYFVFAHEAAHHVNGDTLLGNNWNKDQELAADYSAAVWLTRLGVSKKQLLQTFDSLGFPVESVNGYPTRAERRAKVIQGHDDTYLQLGSKANENADPTGKAGGIEHVGAQHTDPAGQGIVVPLESQPPPNNNGTLSFPPLAIGSASKKVVVLTGVPGFKSVSPGGGILGRVTLVIGDSNIVAEGRSGTILFSYPDLSPYGKSVTTTVNCGSLSVSSSGASARDQSGAQIPDVARVTISSASGSFNYFSKKLTRDETNEIRRKLAAICTE